MSWKLVPLTDSLLEYRARWDELNESLYEGHPLFHSDFVEALLRHFRSGGEHLCVHTRGGRIDGLLIAQPASRFKWALFAPSQWQACPLLVEDPEALQSLLRALPGLVLAIDFLNQDPLYSPLAASSDRRLVRLPHTHTIAIDLQGSFEDYWKPRQRKEIRKKLLRRVRRLSEHGHDFELLEWHDPREIPAAVKRFGDLESAGWKGASGTAVHESNAQGRFYRELLEAFAKRDAAFVFELRISGQPAAMRLCILGPKMLIFLKTSYDEALAQYAPGRLMAYWMLEREFESPRRARIEYYTNADQDLLPWGTSDRWVSHFTGFRSRSFRRLHQLIRSARHRPRRLLNGDVTYEQGSA